MAKLRVMSYLDVGAPQYTTDQRDTVLQLLKMVNQTGYNTKFPTTLVVDANSKTIQLGFSVAHGFTEGHLLDITGTTSNAFQSDNYRVISVPSATSLVCKIDNYSTVTYPASDASTQINVKHKTLGWDVLFSSPTQYSIRSKSAKSSKNVLTIKEPTLARLKFGVATYSSPACVAVHVSENVDGATGEVLNSYIKGHDYQNVESFYWASHNYSWASATIAPNASAIALGDHYFPWWIVGDDKIFYLIVGSYHNSSTSMNYRNASRAVGSYASRQCYMFGDPDFLGDPAFIDKGGCMFSALYKPGGQNVNTPSGDEYPAVFTELFRTDFASTSMQYGTYFVRPLDMTGNSVVPVSYSTIDFPYSSTFYNFSTTAAMMQYPHVTTRGLIFFPYYTRVHTAGTNTFGYYRSLLPYARMCPINLTNISQNWVGFDNVIIKADDGKQILSILRTGVNSTINGSFLYELD